MSINNVVLMGRLVRDVDLSSTSSGVEYANFSVAVDRRYQNRSEEKQADFIDCIAWRQTAVFISKYFRKGSMIAITGEIQTRSYEDKNGNKRKAVEIVVNQASFCGGKNDSSQVETVSQDKPQGDFKDIPYNEDDLPF